MNRPTATGMQSRTKQCSRLQRNAGDQHVIDHWVLKTHSLSATQSDGPWKISYGFKGHDREPISKKIWIKIETTRLEIGTL